MAAIELIFFDILESNNSGTNTDIVVTDTNYEYHFRVRKGEFLNLSNKSNSNRIMKNFMIFF